MECTKCGVALTEENICCEGGSMCKECAQKETPAEDTGAAENNNAVENSGSESAEQPEETQA